MKTKRVFIMGVLLLIVSTTAIFGQTGSPPQFSGSFTIDQKLIPDPENPVDMVTITLVNLQLVTVKKATLYTVPENRFGFDYDGYEQVGTLEAGESVSFMVGLSGLVNEARENGFELELRYTDESGNAVSTRVYIEAVKEVL